jgi:phosphatidylserine decarboxylase
LRLLKLFRLPFALVVLAALGSAVAGFWLLAGFTAVVAALLGVLGRNPVREVPSQPLGIVAPVDGSVDSVSREHDPYLARDALVVRVRQNGLAPAVLCSPTEGRVCQIWAGPEMPGASGGSRLAIHLRTDEDDDVVLVISAARGLPGPLAWSVQPGERVGQGQHRGLAGWGRSVTLYVPGNSEPTVESGQRVHAAASLICELVHEP